MKINGKDFTIGTDPEHFLGQSGEFVSAYGMIPGTKENPHKVFNGAVQVDGMAAEFNIDPVESADDFINNIEVVRQQLAEMVPGFEFLQVASVDIPEDLFNKQPLEALELGCDPDFNCYTMDINEPPNGELAMRTVGGHIHIGGFNTKKPMSGKHFVKMAKLTSLMDEAIGVYSLLWDGDDKRREMYGKAGAFRPKKYGVEWRSLSALWTFKPKLIKFVFDQTEKAIARLFDEDYQPHEDVQQIINKGLRDHDLLQRGEEVEYLKDNHLVVV